MVNISSISNIIGTLKNPRYAMMRICQSLFSHILSDKTYLKLIYYARFGRTLNLMAPESFNEKLNWLKLYDRKDNYTVMADKYAVKAYVSNIIGSEYVVENYGVFDKWDDIDFSKLPESFVIKGTHDSGGAFVCKRKDTFDFNSTRRQIEKNLNKNYFYDLREWPYKNIPPRIIVDRFLDDHTGKELRDYKFWCFGGEPQFMYCTIKGQNIYENFYDMDFKAIFINHNFPRHKPEFETPRNFDLMRELATKLSKNIPFVRVDFFDVDNHVYFGEFTFYDWGGMRPFKDGWDKKLGSLIDLSQLKENENTTDNDKLSYA